MTFVQGGAQASDGESCDPSAALGRVWLGGAVAGGCEGQWGRGGGCSGGGLSAHCWGVGGSWQQSELEEAEGLGELNWGGEQGLSDLKARMRRFGFRRLGLGLSVCILTSTWGC